ncbi:MAG: aminotransferase class V-fold PLP-dependent enzyme [Anaerolineae bacterium]|nr:aminotransferase class V-fold PLP-dependent enzyme [Anaerolineae bacterium]
MADNVRLTIDNVRQQIVGLEAQAPLLDGTHQQYINFDNASSTPALRPVRDKVDEFMTWYSSIHRGAGFKSQIATMAYEAARDLVGCFVGADLRTNTVILGKNATEAINKLAHRFPLAPGDAVLCSLMEHHSNDLPWRRRAKLYHVAVRDDGSLDEEDYDRLLRKHAGRVKLVAISGASNVTGHVNPIHRLAEKAHAAGAKILVDAAQLAPHRAISMRADDDPGHIDFVALSAHKMYAPYGTGALIGPAAVFEQGEPDLVGGGTVEVVTQDDVYWASPPDRDEAGSPNIVGAVALAQAVLCLEQIGMDALARHETDLIAHALRRLRAIDGVQLYGLADPDRAGERLGVIPFAVHGIDHYKVAAVLSFEGGIAVRNGWFCAHPYILRLLKLEGDAVSRCQQDIIAGRRSNLPGLVRVSLGCYNTTQEIDRLADLLARLVAGDLRGEYEQDPQSGDYWPRGFQPDYERYFTLKPGLMVQPHVKGRHGCGA